MRTGRRLEPGAHANTTHTQHHTRPTGPPQEPPNVPVRDPLEVARRGGHQLREPTRLPLDGRDELRHTPTVRPLPDQASRWPTSGRTEAANTW